MFLRKQPSFRESGYVLIMALFVLLLLLSLSMAAIDIGNILMWRLRLDRAAKAGVAAALGYRSLRGHTDIQANEETINNLMRDVVYDNMFGPGVHNSSRFEFGADLAVEYDTTNDSATITSSIHVNTFLLGALNRIKPFRLEFFCPREEGPANSCLVRTRQTAQLDPANVVLVLDTSGSMQCEVTPRPGQIDPCACRTMPDTNCGFDRDGGRIQTRMDQLQDAVETFGAHFNPNRDRIAIVPFNLGADESFSFLDQDGSPRPFGTVAEGDPSFTDVVNGLIPIGNTNPCDGLIRASGQIRALKAQLTERERRRFRPFVVFFTDGAPNAMRASFPEASQYLGRVTAAAAGNPNSDWYQYSIEWIDAAAGGTTYRSPSPLFLRGGDSGSLFNYELNENGLPFRRTDNDILDEGCQGAAIGQAGCRCGNVEWDPDQLKYLNSLRGSAMSDGCLLSLDFSIPTMAGYGVSGVEFQNAGIPPISYTNQLPYYCTLEAADYLRQVDEAAIFVVGLGPRPEDCMTNDPLQDADNAFLRKDNFLARVALDETRVRSPISCEFNQANAFSPRGAVEIADACTHSQQNMSVQIGFTPAGDRSLGSFDRNVAGLYIPIGANQAQRLPTAFSRIAKQILLRLTS